MGDNITSGGVGDVILILPKDSKLFQTFQNHKVIVEEEIDKKSKD